MDVPEHLAGNRAIEQAAIERVITLEARHGRRAVDRCGRPGFPGDLESPLRIDKVKAIGRDAHGADLPVELAQYEEALAYPDFNIGIIDNVRQGDPAKFRHTTDSDLTR